ncbi:hypothetical protein Tco_0815529, partial [Tanacetum coccineum]
MVMRCGEWGYFEKQYPQNKVQQLGEARGRAYAIDGGISGWGDDVDGGCDNAAAVDGRKWPEAVPDIWQEKERSVREARDQKAWFLGFKEVLSRLLVKGNLVEATIVRKAIALLRKAIGSSLRENTRTARLGSTRGDSVI